MIGMKLGPYSLLNKIGEGGFSQVWRGIHRTTKMNVAIKVINKYREDLKMEQVYREIDNMKLLDHPYIAKMYEVIEQGKNVYIIMEYLENGTLHQEIVKNGPLEETKARKYLLQLLEAVKYIHDHDLIHRDIKAENILIDRNSNIRLTDFGFSNSMSVAKTVCGSPSYVSPEMITNSDYNGKTDIWSIGILLYFMLAGFYPFVSSSITKLMHVIVNSKLVFGNSIGQTAQDLITQMLTKDQNVRISIDKIMKHQWIIERDKVPVIDLELFHKVDERTINSFINVFEIDKELLMIKLEQGIIDDHTVAFTILSREYKTNTFYRIITRYNNLPYLNVNLLKPNKIARKITQRTYSLNKYKTFATKDPLKKGSTSRT